MWGVSYPGWLTVQALLDPHPALRRLAAGRAGRPVPLRRRAPQRGLPPQSRIPVPGGDGAGQRVHAVRLWPPRPLRLVPGPRAAVERQRASFPRRGVWVERPGRAPRLRSLLARAGVAPSPGPAARADTPRDRVVGPGGLLRPAPDLRGVREARPRWPELAGRRPVEPRRVDPERRRPPGAGHVRQPHGPRFSRSGDGPLVRPPPQGQG